MASFLLLASLLPSLAGAFTWQFADSPRQCENLNLTASGGTPPYNLFMIPYGPSTLSGGVEVRSLQQITFNDSSSLSFKLTYPANETFIAVVSDSTGFGSGGTTTAVTVLNSDDTSCYNASQSVTGPWVFSINPTGGLTTCQSVRFYWQSSRVQGNVTFKGVIPGGNSFEIPVSTLSTDTNGTGFSWTPDLRPQTNVIIIAGDERGPVGGSVVYIVNPSSDTSCISSDSPSSTAGDPAGGSYPTSTTGAGTGGSGSGGGSSGSSGSSSTNVGAIVGGVVGGVGGACVVVLLAWFLLVRKRRRTAEYNKERPVNILQDDDDDDDRGRAGQLPQYYEPEPFLAPEPLAADDDDGTSVHSSSAAGGYRRPGTPAGLTDITTSSRKTAMPRLRPVNIVQHEDAGPSASAAADEEPETVELPPAYTHIRTAPSTPRPDDAAAPAATATTAEAQA